MGANLFDTLDGAGTGGGRASWAARAPYRPEPGFDLNLLPLSPEWRADDEAVAELERIAAEPAVAEVLREDDAVRLRLDDGWVEATGQAAIAAAEAPDAHADLAAERAYAIYFWGANTTKALHIGHLRNLAIGNAIGAALTQAGAAVEHRSLICDVGRSMGEAMAGVVGSGQQPGGPDGDQKSDHFVGWCYADYVKSSREEGADDGAEDSVARESSLYNDKADELMNRVLRGDQEALELWSKTRAWVISGQRKTLARLGVRFDEVIFESDYLPEVRELTNRGLAAGTLTRRYGDEMVMYETEREELEEMPLVRADGLPTQHMRALAYWAAAPELDDVISLQVCGNEWVSHVTCRRQLIDALGIENGNGNGSARGGGPPTFDVFHGMVARGRESISSSKEGALLIDDLDEWLAAQLREPERREALRDHPNPEALPAQVALGFFLLQPAGKQVEFEPEKLLRGGKDSLGWDLALAEAHRPSAPPLGGAAPADPAYRFAVVQSEMYRRHLGAVVEDFDTLSLSRFLSHFGRWYGEAERPPEVAAVVDAVLAQGRLGLGLEGAR
ncbi:MAG TPA: arginine--tRNA ligase [Solirubrobacterales bacterium]|jgi:arginyl-tRNA synthetase